MMALYDYQCQCGHSTEISHPISEEPEILCPKCVSVMRKGFGTPWVTFGGKGFYSTDKND
jgi:putative FmdB family regulatory protein